MPKYVLRDLPGVAQLLAMLEERDAHPNPNWAPINDVIPGKIDDLSRRLFGITRDETVFERSPLAEEASIFDIEEWGEARDEWESRFEIWTGEEDPETEAGLMTQNWASLGWDISDGAGGISECFFSFYRQMIVSTRGEMGHLPDAPLDPRELDAEADRVAQKLLDSGWARPVQRRSGRG